MNIISYNFPEPKYAAGELIRHKASGRVFQVIDRWWSPDTGYECDHCGTFFPPDTKGEWCYTLTGGGYLNEDFVLPFDTPWEGMEKWWGQKPVDADECYDPNRRWKRERS